MGVVYQGIDLALERPVALKTLPRLEPDSLARLRREARSMASIVHPAIATIHGVETWRGAPVLVVELLAGGTLADRLVGPMPPREVVELGLALAIALQAIHERSLLHRDLKPSNIGFDEHGRLKILDFGLAKLVDAAGPSALGISRPSPIDFVDAHATASQHVVGTLLYLSPEALTGQPASPAQDLWALFLVLWEALAGRHPLQGLPFREAARRLRTADLPDIRLSCGAPEPLADLFDHGLNPRIARRPATAADAHRELMVCLAQLR